MENEEAEKQSESKEENEAVGQKIPDIWIARNYENCSGCRKCEIACSLFHEEKIWPEASRIRVFMLFPGIEVPHLCTQCHDYPCVKACPVDALTVNKNTGAVNVDKETCDACGQCITACPGDIPHLHPEEEYVLICDLCGEEDPKCVEICKAGQWDALDVIDRTSSSTYKLYAETPEEITERTAEKLLGREIKKEVL